VDTADGETIRVRLFGGRGDPLLVFCHGLFGSCDQIGVARFVDDLSAHFDTMVLDFRGHGASTGASTLGADEVQDLHAVAQLASDLGYTKLVAVGASMGGAVAYRCQQKHGDFDSIVSIGAYADLTLMRRKLSRLSLQLLFKTTGTRPITRALTGARLGSLRPMAQPLEAAATIDVPTLIVHGALDPLVEPHHARQLAAAIGPTAELVIVPRRGHVTTLQTSTTGEMIADWVRRSGLG
jgi:pimeloyl-ACP methyl ester carboxylesterase